MCNINLSNLSPSLYQEAVKAAKEGNVKEKMDYLVNLAAEKGFTVDEKTFLQGLASDENIQKLKSVQSDLATIDFVAPGFNFTRNQTDDKPKFEGTLASIKQAFNDYAIQPIKQLGTGVAENTSEVLISNKIGSVESLGKSTLDTLSTKLNSKDQASFLTLCKTLDSKSKETLKTLLESKDSIQLNAKDSKGNTIVDNLFNMSNITKNRSTGEKIDGKALTQQAIAMLKDDKNILQGPHGTCGAGSLENLLRDSFPSELIRIVKDLASDGQAVLADNSFTNSLKISKGSINHFEMGRNQFDRIFQSAIMQRVAVIGGDERDTMLDNITNNIKRAEYDIGKDDGSPNAVKGGDSAADPFLLSNLASRIMKGKVKFETNSNYELSNLLNKDSTYQALASSVAKGKEVIACYKYDGKLTGSRHYVVVNGIHMDKTDKKVYVHFKNTADPSENRMELGEFKAKLEFTIHPKK